MLCSYITWLGSDPFRSSFASGFCLHGRGGRNERECFGCQHRATWFGRNASHHVHRLTKFNRGGAFVSAAFRPKRSHVKNLVHKKSFVQFSCDVGELIYLVKNSCFIFRGIYISKRVFDSP